MNLIENAQVVEAIHPQTAGSAITGDCISMKKTGHVTVVVHINQANAATSEITLEQATSVAASDAKALAKDLPIFLVADCATSDIWVRQTDGVAYTTSAALKHKLVAFEVDAEDLDVAGGFDCLRVKVGASNAANIVAAQYVCGKLRYGPASVIAD